MVKVELDEILKYLDGKIQNCHQMQLSEGYIDNDTRLRLQGETESLEEIRRVLAKWNTP